MKNNVWFTLKKDCLFYFIHSLHVVISPEDIIKILKNSDSECWTDYLFEGEISEDKQQELLKFYLEKNKILINLIYDNANKIYEIKIPKNDLFVETVDINKQFLNITRFFKDICWGVKNEK